MKLKRIEGPATVCHCDGCNVDGIGGSVPYVSASTEEVRQPQDWYDDGDGGLYCATCAAKLAQANESRSRSQFYVDTAGREVHREIYNG